MLGLVLVSAGGSVPQRHFEVTTSLAAGPALAGSWIWWGQRDESAFGSTGVFRGAAGKPHELVYAHDALGIESWSFAGFAGSRSLVAFREVNTVCPAGSDGVVYPCRWRGTTFLSRPAGRPFGISTGSWCKAFPSVPEQLAVAGSRVAAIETLCSESVARRRVVLRSFDGERVLRTGTGADFACCGVSTAGRYVAWASRTAADVYDVRARRIVRSVRVPRAVVDNVAIQSEGTLAVVFRDCAGACPLSLLWTSLDGRTRRLPFAVLRDVRIARNRIVFERLRPGVVTELVVSDLNGRTRRVSQFTPRFRRVGDLDYDGTRVAWATERVTSTSEDCPPPGGPLRPCFLLDDGVRSIWTARVDRRRITAELVAREPFRGLRRTGS